MLNINETTIPLDRLVAAYDLDGNANDSSGNWNDWTATNVTWGSADRGYVEEIWESNWTSTRIETDTILQDWYTVSYWATLVNLTENQCRLWDADRSTTNQQKSCHFRLVEWGFSITTLTPSDGFNAVLTYPISEVWTYHVVAYFKDWDYELTVNWDTVSTTDSYTQPTGLDWLCIFAACDTSPSYDPWKIWLVRMYNKKLSEQEKNALYLEGLRKLWPTNISTSYPKDWLVASYNAEDVTLDTSW